jgi:C4-dicarboxylate-specific signal transduction histidine kinase
MDARPGIAQCLHKKMPPRKEHIDLNEAITEVIVLGRSAIVKNGVSVQTRLSEELFPVHGDRVQLQQVVLNAAEAMGSVEAEPRELLISSEQDHTGVLVAVFFKHLSFFPARRSATRSELKCLRV